MKSPTVPQVLGRTVTRLDAGHAILIESTYSPNTVLPPHVHESAYLTLALRGTFRESSGARSYDFGPGAVMVRPPGTSHSDRFGRHGGTALVVALPRGSSLGERIDDVRYAESGPLVAAATALHREMQAGDSAAPLIIDGILRQTAGWLQRGEAVVPGEAAPPWLATVVEKMRSEFLSAPSIDELAREVDVHPDHLTRTFRGVVGITPGRWLRARRLDWAAEQLATTGVPIGSIAIQAGFCDQSHFTNSFRKRFGISPGRYRAAHCTAGPTSKQGR